MANNDALYIAKKRRVVAGHNADGFIFSRAQAEFNGWCYPGVMAGVTKQAEFKWLVLPFCRIQNPALQRTDALFQSRIVGENPLQSGCFRAALLPAARAVRECCSRAFAFILLTLNKLTHVSLLREREGMRKEPVRFFFLLHLELEEHVGVEGGSGSGGDDMTFDFET